MAVEMDYRALSLSALRGPSTVQLRSVYIPSTCHPHVVIALMIPTRSISKLKLGPKRSIKLNLNQMKAKAKAKTTAATTDAKEAKTEFVNPKISPKPAAKAEATAKA